MLHLHLVYKVLSANSHQRSWHDWIWGKPLFINFFLSYIYNYLNYVKNDSIKNAWMWFFYGRLIGSFICLYGRQGFPTKKKSQFLFLGVEDILVLHKYQFYSLLFCMTGLEPTTYHTQGQHANHQCSFEHTERPIIDMNLSPIYYWKSNILVNLPLYSYLDQSQHLFYCWLLLWLNHRHLLTRHYNKQIIHIIEVNKLALNTNQSYPSTTINK